MAKNVAAKAKTAMTPFVGTLKAAALSMLVWPAMVLIEVRKPDPHVAPIAFQKAGWPPSKAELLNPLPYGKADSHATYDANTCFVQSVQSCLVGISGDKKRNKRLEFVNVVALKVVAEATTSEMSLSSLPEGALFFDPVDDAEGAEEEDPDADCEAELF